MPKNTIREKLIEDKNIKNFIRILQSMGAPKTAQKVVEDFVDYIVSQSLAEFDSLLAEKVAAIEKLKRYCHENNCMAFTENCEGCKKEHFRNIGISDALQILKQDNG